MTQEAVSTSQLDNVIVHLPIYICQSNTERFKKINYNPGLVNLVLKNVFLALQHSILTTVFNFILLIKSFHGVN